MIYDVIIIGGGPAGVAAAVYVARKKMKSLLIAESFGGQSIVSDDIQNWIGEKSISGIDLAKKLEEHVNNFPKDLAIKKGEEVLAIKKIACDVKERECNFEITTSQNTKYQTKSLIVATGARRRRLGIPGEDKFDGKGVSFCSTCDAPLFSGKNVAVIGGGNAGVEAVVDLMPYAKKIYLLNRVNSLSADPVTQEEIKNKSQVELMLGVTPLEVVGKNFVTSLRYQDGMGNKKYLDVDGIFIEIGSVPNSDMVKDLVKLDNHGQIIIDTKHASTSQPGIFAAGDVTDDPYKQNNISAGDGVRAALAAYAYILQRQKHSPATERVDQSD